MACVISSKNGDKSSISIKPLQPVPVKIPNSTTLSAHKSVFFIISFLFFSSCQEKEITRESGSCLKSEFSRTLRYNDLILGIPPDEISALTQRPNELGALGRNKNGYFHVRFQLEMTRLTDYAIAFENEEALSEYLKNLNYSFLHQNPTGDFRFKAPEYLLNDPDHQPPSDANLASGTAFFAYSLGLSLNSLRQSDWYANSNALGSLRTDIESLNPNFLTMLAYLKRSVNLLETADAKAPNRLLFNAIAFYSLGIYLNDQEAKTIGLHFANSALSQRNATDGYFIESGGWDSSYNGVAIKLGFELFTLVSEDAIKNELEKIISCAADWQKSRILPTGEISTEGNTRVFTGGEVFLGAEKGVDVIKTVKAFFYMNTLSNKTDFELLAQRIIEHYK